MKKGISIFAIALIAVMMLSSVVLAAPSTLIVQQNIILIEETGDPGRVSWEEGVVEVVGTGLPPANARSVSQGRLLARRAAIVDAYRNFAEVIKGVQVDAETTLENLQVANDTVKTKVSGVIQGARIVREKAMPDGSYLVVMSLNLYGKDGLAAATLPAVQPDRVQEFPKPIEPVQPITPPVVPVPHSSEHVAPAPAIIQSYTGIIIDARGLAVNATFSPRLYDETGRIVYGNMYIDADFAISQGMVEYATGDEMFADARNGHSRAGAKPLIVKAIEVRDNNCNLVISRADADQMLAANETGGFLKNCAVVFAR